LEDLDLCLCPVVYKVSTTKKGGGNRAREAKETVSKVKKQHCTGIFFNERLLRHVIYILVQRANYWQFVSYLVEVF